MSTTVPPSPSSGAHRQATRTDPLDLEPRQLDDLTAQLQRFADGDAKAFDALIPRVYEHLERIAQSQLRHHQRGLTVETCVLVHETYLKLLGQRQLDFENRQHFFAISALAMRQVLVDHARRRVAAKRGGGVEAVPLDEGVGDALLVSASECDDILALDQALERLDGLDPRLRQVVEMRYFGGLGEREIARVLDVTERTVQRLWRRARAWLRESLE